MHIEGEPVIALCYIKKEGDNANACFLTKENLFIKQKNDLNAFDHGSILNISFEHKILLFPLITGGIIAPLSVHALLSAYWNPWLALIAMVAGLLLMYYGWEGSDTMTIKTAVKDYYFFISRPTANLRAFVSYVMLYISEDPNARQFYFTMSRSTWQTLKDPDLMKVPKPLRLYYWQEIRNQKIAPEDVVLSFNPVEANIPISFVTSEDKSRLTPEVRQDIPTGYIHEMTIKPSCTNRG